jgi:hypothetical protein
MKRWLFLSLLALPLMVSLFVFIGSSRATQNAKPSPQRLAAATAKMKVEVKPWGPTQEMLDTAAAKLADHPQVQIYLKGTRHRLLSVDLIINDEKSEADSKPPNRYRVTFYDYTNDIAVIADSSFDDPDNVEVKVSDAQPLPSNEELDEAVEVLKTDAKLGPAMVGQRVQVYRPMPPLYLPEKSKGRSERIVNIGLTSKGSADKTLELRNEVVGVNLSRGTVVRFPGGAPPTSKAAPAASCGSAASGSTTGRGVAGQYQFTISDGNGAALWSFLAIRPSASSGADASGIELQKVRFKGKLLLKRAHVPILNVNYDNNTCGPFRDWEYAESQFNADPTNGTTVTPGVRSCTVPATTQLDTDVDSGNFQGIAYYEQGDAIILVSEMAAGWYRYISEWGFHKDGTISPRFGMGATSNSCTCNGHVHRAYWRFDFDVNGSSPNRVLEASGLAKPIPINAGITTEMKRYRDKKGIYWIVENSASRDSYMIQPSVNDGTAINDTYGKGDIWFLSYSPAEIDDSAVRTNTSANLDAFVNNQSVLDTDLVVWYAIHINHNRPGGQMMGHPNISGLMVAGPDLVPVRW